MKIIKIVTPATVTNNYNSLGKSETPILGKKCLLNIPIATHKKLKKNCIENDLKISEFILKAIEEKLQR